MIKFRTKNNQIIAQYVTENETSWLLEKFNQNEEYTFNKTYTFSKDDLINNNTNTTNEKPIEFIFATLDTSKEYFLVKKWILCNNNNIYIHKDIEITKKLFVRETNYSIFDKIDNIISDDIYIWGSNKKAISKEEYEKLINSFPNRYERDLYVNAKIHHILETYFNTTNKAQEKYENYIKNKSTAINTDGKIKDIFKESERIKYEIILERLQDMIGKSNNYSEAERQNEILNIILILYPKYICAFEKVRIKAQWNRKKEIDILLVDFNGHIDIIEIKKPKTIITKTKYRNNHIPLKELSGTIMQIEKYIYHLNRRGERGEEKLTDKYKKEIPKGLKIKITNPCGIIISWKEDTLSQEQKGDFEVIKRKYKNIVDIVSYDDLIRRLKNIIEQFKK